MSKEVKVSMILIQRIILQLAQSSHCDDLLKYSKQYGISITRSQAAEVAALMHGKNINIFDEQERRAC